MKLHEVMVVFLQLGSYYSSLRCSTHAIVHSGVNVCGLCQLIIHVSVLKSASDVGILLIVCALHNVFSM